MTALVAFAAAKRFRTFSESRLASKRYLFKSERTWARQVVQSPVPPHLRRFGEDRCSSPPAARGQIANGTWTNGRLRMETPVDSVATTRRFLWHLSAKQTHGKPLPRLDFGCEIAPLATFGDQLVTLA